MTFEKGKSAPQFTLPDGKGQLHSLQDFLGKPVVLYFYPKDLTPGCTKQAEAFERRRKDWFENWGATILGISRDSVERHRQFAEKVALHFPLLSDESGKVCEKYGVWQEKKMYGKTFMGIVRTTFVIAPTGKIFAVFANVKVQGHAEQVEEQLQKLAGP